MNELYLSATYIWRCLFKISSINKIWKDYLVKSISWSQIRYDMITKEAPTQLEQYFQQFRDNIIGIDQEFESPYGHKQILYRLDSKWSFISHWRKINESIWSFCTIPIQRDHHSSGTAMTKSIIRRYTRASADDVLITDGTGMTGVVNNSNDFRFAPEN
jgi:hypothetical protein